MARKLKKVNEESKDEGLLIAEGKVLFELKTPESRTITFNNTQIEVNSYLTLEEQIVLIDNYIQDIDKDEHGFLFGCIDGELNLRNYLYQLKTNIDKSFITLPICENDELFYMISSQIDNYPGFRERLANSIEEYKYKKELKNQLGFVLENALDKFSEVLEAFSELSPESIDKARETGVELIKKLDSSESLSKISEFTKPTPKGKKK